MTHDEYLGHLGRQFCLTPYACSSVTKWVGETRPSSVPDILTGYDPDETPGIGTYYDFFDRITDGPYRRPCDLVVRRSGFLKGVHSTTT